jgi:hypothetical protein
MMLPARSTPSLNQRSFHDRADLNKTEDSKIGLKMLDFSYISRMAQTRVHGPKLGSITEIPLLNGDEISNSCFLKPLLKSQSRCAAGPRVTKFGPLVVRLRGDEISRFLKPLLKLQSRCVGGPRVTKFGPLAVRLRDDEISRFLKPLLKLQSRC